MFKSAFFKNKMCVSGVVTMQVCVETKEIASGNKQTNLKWGVVFIVDKEKT